MRDTERLAIELDRVARERLNLPPRKESIEQARRIVYHVLDKWGKAEGTRRIKAMIEMEYPRDAE